MNDKIIETITLTHHVFPNEGEMGIYRYFLQFVHDHPTDWYSNVPVTNFNTFRKNFKKVEYTVKLKSEHSTYTYTLE